MNADFFVLQSIIGVPDTTCKGCGGESGGNGVLYATAWHPLAPFAERDCKVTKKIPHLQILRDFFITTLIFCTSLPPR